MPAALHVGRRRQRPAARHLFDLNLFGPGIHVEVAADFDQVIAHEIGDGVRARQAVMSRDLPIDCRSGMEVVRRVIGLLVADGHEHAFASVHVYLPSGSPGTSVTAWPIGGPSPVRKWGTAR